MTDKSAAGLSGVALAVAVVVIAAWLLLLVWLAQQTGATEIVWSRLLVVLSSMEAVAFGAAGALFGTHIQRQRVSDAKNRAEQAEKKASENEAEAVKGRLLSRKVKEKLGARTATSAKGAPTMPGATERLSVTADVNSAAGEVLAFAEELYPD